jgi:phage gp46-like protein
MDLALAFDSENLQSDLLLDSGDLKSDGGLASAVVVSLFSDARAQPGDRLPDEARAPWDQVTPPQVFADRRGFWGDVIPPVQANGKRRSIGSRLWLLRREKLTPETLLRAEAYAREALAWLLEDGIARRIDVSAAAERTSWLVLTIAIWRPDGLRFEKVWNLPNAVGQSGGAS